MGNVIYSASPMQAFFSAGGTILFLLALGVVGIVAGAFQKQQGRAARITMIAAGGLLVVVSAAYAVVTLTAASGATRSVLLNLDDKQVAVDNCDNGQTCTRYVLEAVTSTSSYDFNVPKAAYEKVEVNTCYQFTYYPSSGLFSQDTASYQQINNIARIETADPSRCQ